MDTSTEDLEEQIRGAFRYRASQLPDARNVVGLTLERRKNRTGTKILLVTAAVVVVAAVLALSQFWQTSSPPTSGVTSATTNDSELPAILRRPATAADVPPANLLGTNPRGFRLTDYRLLRDDGATRWYVASADSNGRTLLFIAKVGGAGSSTWGGISLKDFASTGILSTSAESTTPATTVSFFVPDDAQVLADGHPVTTTNNLAVWQDNSGPLPQTVQFVTPSHKSELLKVSRLPQQP